MSGGRPGRTPGAAAEGAGGGRDRLPAGERGADRGRRVTVDGRVAELGDRVDPQTAEIHVDGERVVIDQPPGLPGDEQAARGGVDDGRRAAAGRRSPTSSAYAAAARLPRRPAGRRQRGAAAADERRRAGPPADAPVLRGGEDLPGRGARPGPHEPGGAPCRPGSSWRTGRSRSDAFRVVDSVGPGTGGGRAARGAQAHRPADAGGGRVPGDPAGPHLDRSDQARRPEVRPAPRGSTGGRSRRCSRPSTSDGGRAGPGVRPRGTVRPAHRGCLRRASRGGNDRDIRGCDRHRCTGWEAR